MNCRTARAWLPAYLDSELDTPRILAVNAHLEHCAACRRRYDSERRLETAFAARLRAGPAADSEVVEGVLARLGARTRWRQWPSLLAAAALLAVFLLWRAGPPGYPELVQAAAADHAEYQSGRMGPDLPAADPAAVRDYLEPLLGVSCPPLPAPPEWRILGPRLCFLKGARVGLVMLERQGNPVSLFVLPPASARALGWDRDPAPRHFALGPDHAVVAASGAAILCAVGALPRSELERIATAR